MKDIEIRFENKPGMLALMGETLGRNGVSLEGGGVFSNGATATAHFLVEDAARATEVLNAVDIEVVRVSEVVIQKLRQDVPGQLGLFCRRLADAGVNIEVQYSDHSNQLIVVPDDFDAARRVAAAWMEEWWPA